MHATREPYFNPKKLARREAASAVARVRAQANEARSRLIDKIQEVPPPPPPPTVFPAILSVEAIADGRDLPEWLRPVAATELAPEEPEGAKAKARRGRSSS